MNSIRLAASLCSWSSDASKIDKKLATVLFTLTTIHLKQIANERIEFRILRLDAWIFTSRSPV